MNRNILISPVGEEISDWSLYVQRMEKSTNYHQYEWKEVIETSFGHETFYLIAKEGGRIRGVLPLVLIRSRIFGNYLGSLPFFNYAGILADDADVESALLDEAKNISVEKSADYLELRCIEKKDLGILCKQHKVTMILDLEKDPDSQWKAFNAKLRNQVRKAEKSGLTFHVFDRDGLAGFYKVFATNMRDLGTPVYSSSFFKNLLEILPGSSRVISVMHEGDVIASGIACSFRDTLEVPWASSLRKFKALCPNNLLYWGVIRLAVEEGYRFFDFGRSTPGEGTFRFKEQWGARQVPLHWQYWINGGEDLPDVNPSNPKYRMAISLWKRLPLPVANLIGPSIVKNIP